MSSSKTNKSDSVRFHYLRDRRPQFIHTCKDGRMSRGVPIACIASRIEDSVLFFGISTVHSSKDTFSYPLARRIANNRLEQFPHQFDIAQYLLKHHDHVSGRDMSRLIMREISFGGHKEFPTRVVKAARTWLDYVAELEEQKNRTALTAPKGPMVPRFTRNELS